MEGIRNCFGVNFLYQLKDDERLDLTNKVKRQIIEMFEELEADSLILLLPYIKGELPKRIKIQILETLTEYYDLFDVTKLRTKDINVSYIEEQLEIVREAIRNENVESLNNIKGEGISIIILKEFNDKLEYMHRLGFRIKEMDDDGVVMYFYISIPETLSKKRMIYYYFNSYDIKHRELYLKFKALGE